MQGTIIRGSDVVENLLPRWPKHTVLCRLAAAAREGTAAQPTFSGAVNPTGPGRRAAEGRYTGAYLLKIVN